MTHNNNLQGFVIFIAGILLLLYALNIVTAGITVLLVMVSIALIFYGGSMSGMDDVIKKLLKSVTDYFNHSRKH